MSVGTARVELGNEEQSRSARPGKGAHPSYARSREGGDSLVTTMPAFNSAKEAAEMVRAGLDYLAAADAAQLADAEQAECQQMMEQADAITGPRSRRRGRRGQPRRRPCPEHPGASDHQQSRGL